MDDISNVNEMRIKVLSSYLYGTIVVRCPEDKKKKNASVVKNIALMQWKAVEKAI